MENKFYRKNKLGKKGIILIIILAIFPIISFFRIIKDLNCLSEERKSLDRINIEMKASKELPFYAEDLNRDTFYEALLYYEVKHPKLVLAQAILETGNFKSYNCVVRNNVLGLVNSFKNPTKENPYQYFEFNAWEESIIAYIKYVEYKIQDDEDYLDFLERIGYAEDPEYSETVRKLYKTLKF